MNTNRLNNFILWCKNWYKPIDKNMPMFEQARAALYLDDYICCRTDNDVLNIVLIFLDDLIAAKVIEPFRMQTFYNNIKKNKHWYKLSDDESVLWTIRDFFAWELENKAIKLNPPNYNRAVYKLGFKAPRQYGNSYKMANFKIKQLFNHK